MDGLVEELMRLENAKHKALVLIDAPAYDATVREQMRLLAASKQQSPQVASVERFQLQHGGEFFRAAQLLPNDVGSDFCR